MVVPAAGRAEREVATEAATAVAETAAGAATAAAAKRLAPAVENRLGAWAAEVTEEAEEEAEEAAGRKAAEPAAETAVARAGWAAPPAFRAPRPTRCRNLEPRSSRRSNRNWRSRRGCLPLKVASTRSAWPTRPLPTESYC